ncbi:hypothetical protein HCU64_23350 [Methylobacterium sp. C25]|uniref:hypothetical protein n=1 Tax=Methylobacterium sp. C25 TaxID=2721622 RepID=UPI001F48A208|nr:hypothetical protein [Methylobacterium sp. C25]MCE4226683.1 hypothetical protein [Methylobacterium sp. C25]
MCEDVASSWPRAFRGILRGTGLDGFISIELAPGSVVLHACPIESVGAMLLEPSLLGPGVYVLLGIDEEQPEGRQAIVGEGGSLQERLAAHASDQRCDFCWEIVAFSGPGAMNDTIRLILQRLLLDEIRHNGFARIANRHDAERHTGGLHDVTAARALLEEMRTLLRLVRPGLVAATTPPRLPISARSPRAPRGVEEHAPDWVHLEMRHRGAHATVSVRGGEVVLLPGSSILSETRSTARWLLARRRELTLTRVLTPLSSQWLLVSSMVRFDSLGAATAFVTGGASTSSRLTWTPVCDD